MILRIVLSTFLLCVVESVRHDGWFSRTNGYQQDASPGNQQAQPWAVSAYLGLDQQAPAPDDWWLATETWHAPEPAPDSAPDGYWVPVDQVGHNLFQNIIKSIGIETSAAPAPVVAPVYVPVAAPAPGPAPIPSYASAAGAANLLAPASSHLLAPASSHLLAPAPTQVLAPAPAPFNVFASAKPHENTVVIPGGYPAHNPSQVIYKLIGMHVPGGWLAPGVNDLYYCLHACAKNATCFGFDFDHGDRTCWFHASDTVCNPPMAMEDSINYKFDPCPTTTMMPTSTTTTAIMPMTFQDTNAPNGVLQAGISDRANCILMCQSTPTCVALDFDANNQCWFHTVVACTLRQPSIGTEHIALRCP